MTGKHATAGVPHNAAHGVPFPGPVTMDRTFGAGGFSMAKRTAFQTHVGVVQQCLAVGAEVPHVSMGAPTVNPNHRRDRSLVHPNVKRSPFNIGGFPPGRHAGAWRPAHYFFPMEAPHLGQVNEENRNPGLGGTGVPHLGQCPSPPPPCFGPFTPGSDIAPAASKVFPTFMVFCWFRPGMCCPLAVG